MLNLDSKNKKQKSVLVSVCNYVYKTKNSNKCFTLLDRSSSGPPCGELFGLKCSPTLKYKQTTVIHTDYYRLVLQI